MILWKIIELSVKLFLILLFPKWVRLVRFNIQQAIFIDIALAIPFLLESLISAVMGQLGLYYHRLFINLFTAYCVWKLILLHSGWTYYWNFEYLFIWNISIFSKHFHINNIGVSFPDEFYTYAYSTAFVTIILSLSYSVVCSIQGVVL